MANFNIGTIEEILYNDDDDWETLNEIFDETGPLSEINVSTSTDEALKELHQVLNECQPSPNITQGPKRFKQVSQEEIDALKAMKQSKSTKNATKWGVKVFQDWSIETYAHETDLGTISPEHLDKRLAKFYAEATPKCTEKRVEKMSINQAAEYHKNTMKSLRSAINRRIRDLDRDFDIVRDRQFKNSNDILDGKLKTNLKEGLSRPTKHKEIIPINDLNKIFTYLYGTCNPVILRFRIWFLLSFHFVTRGLEFHEQLRRNSFVFVVDENGDEFVTLSHETKEKNWQGGIDTKENQNEKRMYATAGPECPVQSLKLFLSKTDPCALHLFNRCDKSALASPETYDIWYNDIPLRHYNFTRFMADICKQAGCVTYTAHCLRATAIQGMNDAGYEIRHIMHMSGHKNEPSVRSYNRDCSTAQKKAMSETLASLASGNAPIPAFHPAKKSTEMKPCTAVSQNHRDEAVGPSNFALSSNVMSAGLLSNSSFANCIFNVNVNK